MPAWFWLLSRTHQPLLCSLVCQAAIVALLFSLELAIPHPTLPPRPPGTLHIILFYNFAATAVAVALPSLAYVPLAHAIGNAARLAGLWPASAPLWAQIALALLIVDFNSYWWHRLEHRPPAGQQWMWRLHSVHHAPTHFDLWMGPQVHPIDVAIFGLVGYAFVALLGAPALAIEAAAFFASIVGAMHHLRAETRCGVLNRIFPFGDNHVVHHSPRPEENGNYGNITTLFDQLFGSYLPPRVEATEVGAYSLAPDYPQRDLQFQLLSPFGRHWQRATRKAAANAE
jgi:sterol desaturase/sphingolipid hydroxylase (fatty acid hydroxylase superfamily)